MSVADRQYAIRLELDAITKDMRGISPKTSLYIKLTGKREAILRELETIGAQRTHV